MMRSVTQVGGHGSSPPAGEQAVHDPGYPPAMVFASLWRMLVIGKPRCVLALGNGSCQWGILPRGEHAIPCDLTVTVYVATLTLLGARPC
jgi:hypothetical protein